MTIKTFFEKSREDKIIAFMPFFVTGFPDYNTSFRAVMVAAEFADVIEISMPYSDPLSDGPVIQQANQIALQNGMTVDKFFRFIKKLRSSGVTQPIVLMIYCNIIFAYGIDKFYSEANEAGADAILIPDLPLEECGAYRTSAKKNKLEQVYLAALTTDKSRLGKISKLQPCFIYLVSVLGTTGSRKRISGECLDYLKKNKFDTPVCVGFGLSNKSQAKILQSVGADGYIIGSLLVKFIRDNHKKKKFLSLFRIFLNKLKV